MNSIRENKSKFKKQKWNNCWNNCKENPILYELGFFIYDIRVSYTRGEYYDKREKSCVC